MDKPSLPTHDLANMPKAPRFPPSAVRVIELLAYPSVQLLDVSGPLQVFASANDRADAAGVPRPYEIRVVAQGGQGVTTSSGLGLASAALSAVDDEVDTLIIAGGPGVKAASIDASLVAWVQARAGRARRVASVCTGAFLLAASGVLDGRRATTHCRIARSLRSVFRAFRWSLTRSL